MNCEEARSEIVDRDLSMTDVEKAVRIAEHFKHCPECQSLAAQYDQTRSLLQAPEDASAEPPLKPLLLADYALRLAGPSRREKLPRWGNLTMQTALAVVALFGWGLYWRQNAANRAASQIARDHETAVGDAATARPPAVVPASLAWTPAEVDRGAALFSKVSESFDGRAAWVAVGDHASDVGLLEAPTAPPPKVLLVRLRMSQDDRAPAKTDLLIVPGQEVRVEVPFQAGETLHYHLKTTAGDQSRLMLAAEVRSRDHAETLAALATELQPQPGEALSAGRLQSRSGPFHLEVSFSQAVLVN